GLFGGRGSGVVWVPRGSSAVLARGPAARLRRARPPVDVATPARMDLEPASVAAPSEALAPPVVVETRYPRGRLAEQGLAWQETFDFGRVGAESFQLAPVALLRAHPAAWLKRTPDECQDNADAIRH